MELILSMRYSLHIIFHPFDGFWDMKHEKRGSLKAALIILLLTVFTDVLSPQYTGFLFNWTNINTLNTAAQVMGILLPVALWCIANWCLTTLMDGEGSFKDIVTATCYALTPMLLINVIMILISNILVYDEGSVYYFLSSVSILWTMGLILFGTMVIHQFTLTKTLLTAVCIVIGMGLLIFIALLFFNLLQQIFSFVYLIYREIIFRM